MVGTPLRPRHAAWAGAQARCSSAPEELKPRAVERQAARRRDGDHHSPWQDRSDWWLVAAMVAAVLGGSALVLYALIQWAAGM